MTDLSMTPGLYLQQHRINAGMSHDDIALRIDTEPKVSASRRAEWLRSIESDIVPIRPSTMIALHGVKELQIDLAELAAIIEGPMTVRFIQPLTMRELNAKAARNLTRGAAA